MSSREEDPAASNFENHPPVAKDNLIPGRGDSGPSWHNAIKHNDYASPYDLLMAILQPGWVCPQTQSKLTVLNEFLACKAVLILP